VPSLCLVRHGETHCTFVKKIPRPTGSGAREVPDDLMKGPVLKVYHSGAATWSVRYRNKHRQQRRLALGRYPKYSVEKARASTTSSVALLAIFPATF